MASAVLLHGATSGTSTLIASDAVSPTITLPATTGTLATSAGIIGGLLNAAVHVGGTWVADAVWTLPAHTLGGAVTGNGQNITGVGTLSTTGEITRTITSNGGLTLDANASSGVFPVIKFRANHRDWWAGALDNGSTDATWALGTGLTLGSNKVIEFSITALTLGSGITSISGGTNPSLNIGTGALTAGAGTFSGQVAANLNTANGILLQPATTTNAANIKFINGGGNTWFGVDNSDHTSFGTSANYAGFVDTPVEFDVLVGSVVKARITSAGINGALGGTTPAAATTLTLSATGDNTFQNATGNAQLALDSTNASSRGAVMIFKQNGTQRGSVSVSGWLLGNTNSDFAIAGTTGNVYLWGGGQTTNGLSATSTGVAVTGTLSATGVGTILNATAIPAGGTAGSGYKFSSTANYGVFFGSGAPTLSAAQGSLYLRSDGTTTNDRAYINTNGTTGWTALTTAA